MQLPTEIEHYKSDIEAHEYQIKRYQRFNLKPNRENMGSVSKSRALIAGVVRAFLCSLTIMLLIECELLRKSVGSYGFQTRLCLLTIAGRYSTSRSASRARQALHALDPERDVEC